MFGTITAPLLVAGSLVGALVGLGGYTFLYARGASYLTNDPAACVNCHVMRDEYDGWRAGSHRAVAVCNDCHTPHDVVGKYTTKALNGFWHSFYFTFGGYPDPIRITPRNARITEAACRSCHAAITDSIDRPTAHANEAISCIGCHRAVGHLE